MKTFATLISALFHPLMILTYGLVLALSFTYLSVYPLSLRTTILAFTFLSTSLLPSLLIALLIRANVVSNAELTHRNERFIPYLIFILSYLICLFYLYRMRMPIWLLATIVAACCSLLLALAINFFWKISAHSIAIGSLLGAVSALSSILHTDVTPALSPLILIAGLVLSSRLYLNRHTPAQVYAGFLFGFVSLFSILLLSRLYFA
jgi:membrane-associated phospholipid phosphatase